MTRLDRQRGRGGKAKSSRGGGRGNFGRSGNDNRSSRRDHREDRNSGGRGQRRGSRGRGLNRRNLPKKDELTDDQKHMKLDQDLDKYYEKDRKIISRNSGKEVG